MHMNIRLTAFTFAVLMLLAVSVHPAMAQMEVKQKIDQVNMAVSDARKNAGCPGCAMGMSPDQAALYLNKTNMSVEIRQIELDSGYSGPTVANARTVRLPVGTLKVHAAEGDPSVSSIQSGRAFEIIADYDNDPAVREYIRNVTLGMGYTERTNVEVGHYAADMKGVNITDNTKAVFEVVTYTYTNATTKYRFKFLASQSIETGGRAIPPKLVTPGHEFPPYVQGKGDDAECWYWYLLIGIAVLAVIAAILATIALAVIGGAAANGRYQSTFGKSSNMAEPPRQLVVGNPQVVNEAPLPVKWEPWPPEGLPPDVIPSPPLDPDHPIYHQPPFEDISPEDVLKLLSIKSLADGRPLMKSHPNLMGANSASIGADPAPMAVESGSTGSGWMMGWILLILIFLILIGLAFPIVAVALVFLISMVISLLACKGIVNDANDRARLEEILNPEILVGITERSNNQTVFVTPLRSSQIMVVLPEKTENGVRYTWNVTASPATVVLPMVMADPDSPDARTRSWLFFSPVNKTMTFSARYVPADNLAGRGMKQFSVRIVPFNWAQPEEVDTSSKWVGYGTSLAIDNRTDRMHISYLDYSGTWGGAGKLIYRSGIGSQWDPPLVVDDTISWTTKSGNEMARYTSIALDPDGNPQISYMDWRNGHLKFARKITPKDANMWRGGVTIHDGWLVETVDHSSSYAGWGSSIAVDQEGNPHISYLRQANYLDTPELKYAHWVGMSPPYGWDIQTIAKTTSPDPIIETKWWTENVQDGAGTSIALDSSGRPHISYTDAEGGTCHDTNSPPAFKDCFSNMQLKYTSWDGSKWITESVDKDLWRDGVYTRHGLYSSLAMDTRDHPHISYFSYWDSKLMGYNLLGSLKYASFDGFAWKTGIVDSSTNSVGLYSSLKIDKNGNPHISYMDWKNGFLRYATSSGGSFWFRSVPDRQNSDTGRFSSLALDSKGFPRIVYMDYRNGHVKYVYGTFPELSMTGMVNKSRAATASAAGNSVTGSAGAEQVMLLQLPVPAPG